MKLLFDPIYTTSIDRCASAIKFYRLAVELLKDSTNIIYWCIPPTLSEEELGWLPSNANIVYIPTTLESDRYKEYRRIPKELELVYNYLGDFWDWDIAITNRTSMVPTISAMANRHHIKDRDVKPIILIEDFPLMQFKYSNAIPSTSHQDKYTLLGYQTAAETAISAYWEKEIILEESKKYVSFYEVRQIREKITECHPFPLAERLSLKNKEFVSHQNGSPFTIVFAGRMIIGHHFDKIFNVMGTNWILKSHEREINPVVCTQSKGIGKIEVPDYVKVNYFSRDAFWDFLKNKASVGVFFSEEEDYSMSLIEPLIFGVPYAVFRAPWSEVSLGKDYPFFFTNENQAYAIVKAFYDDYPSQYLKFATWQQKIFKPVLIERDKITIITIVKKHIEQYKKVLGKTTPHEDKEALVNLLFNELTSIPQTLYELISKVGEKIEVRNIKDKLKNNEMHIKIAFSSDRYKWKLQLLARGAKEGVKVGTYYL